MPPVSGHNGSDYGRGEAYNILTGQWGEIAYKTTNNGVTLSGQLPTGTYTQMRFYYYTNHDCMYNKSNITYSIVFDFLILFLERKSIKKELLLSLSHAVRDEPSRTVTRELSI